MSNNPKTVQQLHFDVLNAAHRLTFGHIKEQHQALEDLAHLIFVLQREQPETKKEINNAR